MKDVILCVGIQIKISLLFNGSFISVSFFLSIFWTKNFITKTQLGGRKKTTVQISFTRRYLCCGRFFFLHFSLGRTINRNFRCYFMFSSYNKYIGTSKHEREKNLPRFVFNPCKYMPNWLSFLLRLMVWLSHANTITTLQENDDANVVIKKMNYYSLNRFE